MTKTTLLAAVLAATTCLPAFAASVTGVSHDGRLTFAAPDAGLKPGEHIRLPPKAVTIYSNLATLYPKGVYFSGEGDTLSGPNSALGATYWAAGGFTPTASAKAASVAVAVGIVEGANEITISIYPDAGGVPGTTPLASGVAKALPTFGTCCGLATLKIKGGVSLTAGTPYWVTATTDKSEATTYAAWMLATSDQVDTAPAAYSDGGAWSGYATPFPPAFAVYSK